MAIFNPDQKTFWLVFLAFGGLYGGITMLLDPSGALLGVDNLLPLLPVPDFALPGLFLFYVMGLVSLVLAFGLFARLNWSWAEALSRWSGHSWASNRTLVLGIVLFTWLVVQAVMQCVMVVNCLALIGSAQWLSVRSAYRGDNR